MIEVGRRRGKDGGKEIGSDEGWIGCGRGRREYPSKRGRVEGVRDGREKKKGGIAEGWVGSGERKEGGRT